MGRVCTICQHPERDAIEARLVSGDSSYAIAEAFGVGASAVQRHHANHTSPALAAMETQAALDRKATLLDRIETLIERAEAMFATAASAGQSSQALNVLRELRALLELLGKATGELREQPAVAINLLTMPEVSAAIGVVYRELADQPALRRRIAERLQLEAGPRP